MKPNVELALVVLMMVGLVAILVMRGCMGCMEERAEQERIEGSVE